MLHQQIDMEVGAREAWALRRQLGIPNNRRLWVLACMDEPIPVNEGFFFGGIKAVLMTLIRDAFPGWRIDVEADAAEPRDVTPSTEFAPEKGYTFNKADAVFSSGNNTRGDIPSHLIVPDDVPAEVAEFYEHMCPAAVYEAQDGKLVVNSSNCVDCRTADILGPHWTPREGGAGTKYQRM